jgi:regulator of sigma E protease
MDILIFIFVLSFLVIIHELGHFLLAKKFGVKVKEFGIGYPPKILNLFKYQETEFTLNAIPIGGFVNLSGENNQEKELNKEDQFYFKTPKQRLAIILGGVTVNFIFGLLVFSIISIFRGIPEQLNGIFIGEVIENSPASKAKTIEKNFQENLIGIQSQTKLVEVTSGQGKNEEITSIQQVQEIVKNNKGQNIILKTQVCPNFNCQDKFISQKTYVRTDEETPSGEGSIGIAFQENHLKKYPFYQMPFRGIYFGVQESFRFAYTIVKTLGQILSDLIIRQKVPQEIAGPVGIVHQIQKVGIFQEGFLSIFFFAGILSINLAVMNLLPIPALDGGRAFFIFLEMLVGRKKIEKVEYYSNYVGMLLLLGLTVLITFNDIKKIITGG